VQLRCGGIEKSSGQLRMVRADPRRQTNLNGENDVERKDPEEGSEKEIQEGRSEAGHQEEEVVVGPLPARHA
jgi:hypothetical protein